MDKSSRRFGASSPEMKEIGVPSTDSASTGADKAIGGAAVGDGDDVLELTEALNEDGSTRPLPPRLANRGAAEPPNFESRRPQP